MAKFMMMAKSLMTNKCTPVVGPFNGNGGAPGQYRQHHPMRHVQGYLGSHWTPPLGNYLLHIAPAAARETGKQPTTNNYTYFAGRFDGHGNVPVSNRAHRPMEEVQGFTRSHWTLHHWASIMSDNKKGTWLRHFFL
jgi:hypothetical protein